jgi:hypothetical protein
MAQEFYVFQWGESTHELTTHSTSCSPRLTYGRANAVKSSLYYDFFMETVVHTCMGRCRLLFIHLFINQHTFIHIRSQAAEVETCRENELRSSHRQSPARMPVYVASCGSNRRPL